MRVLYLDVLILLNSLIDYFSLKLAFAISRKNGKTVRLGAAAVVGGMLSLLIFVNIESLALQLGIKLLTSFLISCIASGARDIHGLIKITLSLFICSMLICGISSTLSSGSPIHQNNYFIYWGISPITLILAIALSYLLLFALESIFPETRPVTALNIEIEIKGDILRFKAFLDSGNMLRSAVDGKSVIFLDLETFSRQIGTDITNKFQLSNALSLINEGYHVRYIPYSTIDDNSVALGICCKLRMLNSNQPVMDVVAIIKPLNFKRDDITAIIGNL